MMSLRKLTEVYKTNPAGVSIFNVFTVLWSDLKYYPFRRLSRFLQTMTALTDKAKAKLQSIS